MQTRELGFVSFGSVDVVVVVVAKLPFVPSFRRTDYCFPSPSEKVIALNVFYEMLALCFCAGPRHAETRHKSTEHEEKAQGF